MTRILGVALAAVVAGACGHATTTGSARNDWATPTGHAAATNPRYINPDAAAHPARNRSDFAKREAPTAQPEPLATPPSPPPPDIYVVPDTEPRRLDELPPWDRPIRP